MDAPLRFEPFLRPLVWGGRRLGERLGKPLPTAETYGESWEISDHALHHSIVATGPLKGRSLRSLMEHERRALLGAAAAQHTTFPWLVKFLDACDWLSVQVHPDELAVRNLWPGEGSKTEAWFVLDAAPESRIYAGLLPGTDEARLRAALAHGTVADCLHHFRPRAGDCVFLPAGTVHAIGGGVLLAEVQQTSDATFRLFDWNRRDARGQARTLHRDEALASIDWSRGPVEPIRAVDFESTAAACQMLVRCPYFILEHIRWTEPCTLGGSGRLQTLIVVSGSAHLQHAGGAAYLEPGQAWLLPASMPPRGCQPVSSLGALLCTLPDAQPATPHAPRLGGVT